MHVSRLERLAKLLEQDAANPKGVQFNISQWAGPAWGDEHEGAFPTKKIKVDCGTMACGMGLAALSGEFKKDGLTYTLIGSTGSYMLCPTFMDNERSFPEEGFDAAEALFEIARGHVEYLFDADYYPEEMHKGAKGELYMAKRIRALIAGKIDTKWHPDFSQSLRS